MFKFIKRVCALFIVLLIFYQVLVIRHNVHRVLAYKPMVEKTLAENDTKANVDLVLAMIYTETKGGEADVMQSSESSSGKKDSITDSQSSIEHGVSLLSHNLALAEEAGVDSWTAVQAYNFGLNYIPYVAKRGGKNTLTLAEKYSKEVLASKDENGNSQKYRYWHVEAFMYNGGYLYRNGGNFFYAQKVKQNMEVIHWMNQWRDKL